MRDINIKATEYFEAVARLGTVTKAAYELGVSASAVSQQLTILEQQLGVRLFRREKKRLVLTLDGDRFFKTATQAFRALRNAKSAILQQREVRAMSLRVSPSFGVRWLASRIGSFIADNPGWNVRVDATPDFTDFETEKIDLDLRYGFGGWVGLSEKRVMHDMVLPLCSPAYLEELRQSSQDAVGQIKAARLIDSVKALYRWDLWLAQNDIDIPSLSYPFRFDRSSMSIELAKQGGGVALDSVALCLPEIQRGELVPLAPDYPVIEFAAYHVVCPDGHLDREIVEKFSDWVTRAARVHEYEARAALSGLGCSFIKAPNLFPERT
ncbi:LysR family transcriptional regulator [Pelagibacterium sp. H642]|uniref:LysR family transcriptional regulator n=1 Tax=Pelagibacterium sp. H642 TaxID=1881069 RepID=UPI0028169F0C|nr:LysR family transcriptional regulator [Pelagibacterium sp. H642]WMT91878.1 LysR family transcriptional regulator [Pelagibacterium sp. H642]